jgi:hypothetical protein
MPREESGILERNELVKLFAKPELLHSSQSLAIASKTPSSWLHST